MVISSVCCIVLLAACVTAQTHKPPDIPAAFSATFTIEYHGGAPRTEMGNGTLAQDPTKREFMRNVTLDDKRGDEGEYLLRDYANKKEYIIRGTHDCRVDDLNEDFISIFAFAQNTEYAGIRDVRGRKLDIFKLTGAGDVTLEIGVDPADPNVPVIYNKMAGREDEMLFFLEFKEVTPPSSSFTVPAKCRSRL